MTSNNSGYSLEHFVTLFDNNFLPMGLCLHRSLLQHAEPFHLWILCMDEEVERNLRAIALPHVSLIALREAENDRLLKVKSSRTSGEYCWTLTPFTPHVVFVRDPTVQRVTYLDADLFFFGSPKAVLEEFQKSGKHVLITEHAYAPAYDKSRRNGKFCVQFITVRRTREADRVMSWWQDRCLEWCYARVEGGKFGDQKYLDCWPTLFASEVHVLQHTESALGPWNVRSFARRTSGRLSPVFYHFHGLRLLSPTRLLLYSGYNVGQAGREMYRVYESHISEVITILRERKIPVPCIPLRRDLVARCRRLKRRLFGGEEYTTLSPA
jgi:hypothetical protein